MSICKKIKEQCLGWGMLFIPTQIFSAFTLITKTLDFILNKTVIQTNYIVVQKDQACEQAASISRRYSHENEY